MIVKNSEKHKHNPEFIDDSIETLQNVVKKIEHILGQLKKGNIKSEQTARVNLREIIHDVQIQQSHMQPQVDFLIDSGDYWVQAEKFKLISILGHLVQNAQEATSDDGQVSLHLSRQPGEIVLEIADTGCGMDEVFIQQRLFKPFDTTKGNAGMGIGVYEANEYIQQLGGKIHVTSQVGRGTTFTMILPLQNKQELDDVLLDCELHHQTG
jgi:putative PEP-CTERM system histidine kinase